jgi:predicted nucleotidyltransferase
MSSSTCSESAAAQAQQAIASTVQNSVQTEQNSKHCNDGIHTVPDHGLPERTVDAIRLCLQQFPQLHWSKLYGSRAMGRHWRGSDIDLAFSADENCSANLHAALDQLPSPYLFDVTHWESLHHSGLREHIERVGIPFPDPQP